MNKAPAALSRRFAIGGLVSVAAIVVLVITSFSSAVLAEVSPTALQATHALIGVSIGLQGIVRGADHENAKTLSHLFLVSDKRSTVQVAYDGDLPGGFKAGASVEARGIYNGKMFAAVSLTAKCPTKYQAAPSRA